MVALVLKVKSGCSKAAGRVRKQRAQISQPGLREPAIQKVQGNQQAVT
jgi:hypothetical protein